MPQIPVPGRMPEVVSSDKVLIQRRNRIRLVTGNPSPNAEGFVRNPFWRYNIPMGIGFIIRIGATLILLAFAFLLALAALGYSDILLRALNIPAMRPFFADLRTIPSVEQFALHDNIRTENFSDPWGRPFNYPKVWVYLLQPFRVCRDAYFCLGSLQVLLFLGLVIGLVWRVSLPLTVVPILLLALSPPITLLLERGNTDGLIFLLVLLSVYWGGPFRTPFLIALAAGL